MLGPRPTLAEQTEAPPPVMVLGKGVLGAACLGDDDPLDSGANSWVVLVPQFTEPRTT